MSNNIHPTTVFCDTNVFLENIPVDKNILSTADKKFITETTWKELKEKLANEKKRRYEIKQDFSTLHFGDLYFENPQICPLYYYYISAMYNPANICDGNFFEEMCNHKIIKGIPLTSHEESELKKIHKKAPQGQEHFPDGTVKPAEYKFLEMACAKTAKKARKSFHDKHPAFMNDIKSLSLILYYSLYKKHNILYFTADKDPCSLLLLWVQSMCNRHAIIRLLLPKISDFERVQLMRNAELYYYIDIQEYFDIYEKMQRDIVTLNNKDSGFRFSIYYWNSIECHGAGKMGQVWAG